MNLAGSISIMREGKSIQKIINDRVGMRLKNTGRGDLCRGRSCHQFALCENRSELESKCATQ